LHHLNHNRKKEAMSAVLDQPITTDIATREPRDTALMPGFTSGAAWELAQRVAKAFASSTIVPESYRGNVANCLIALEMANRIGASPLLVMTNLYVVHGTPAWSSKFLIASLNQCGRFSAIRYEFLPDRTGCRAWTVEKATGERIEGPMVTLAMAKDEGWSTKAGSKWKTMPELMLCYRAAAFLIRIYAPEISMGLRTDDEVVDMGPAEVVAPREAKAAEIGALLNAPPPATPPASPVIAKGLQHFRERLDNAIDADQAALVLDEARNVLDATDYEQLTAAYRAAWSN
jgi:hypothetical protein